MNAIDLTPLYRNTIGFDRFASLLDRALVSAPSTQAYPPYNIEVLDDNEYAITLAVAGFSDTELDINVEKNILTVSGNKEPKEAKNYLHQGISNRAFKRKFNLADYVDVTNANLSQGLLTIELVKEVPEAMKPKSIAINLKANAMTSQVNEEKTLT